VQSPEERDDREPNHPVRPLFPRWANSATSLGLWSMLAVLVGAPSFLMAWVRSPLHTDQFERVDQPVAFDHRHHVRDDGIECRYCHYDAARARFAGLPETELCMGCHSQVWNKSPMLEPVRQSFFEHRPIRWRRVHALADFVYFDHSIHVAKGVGCETCHGRVDLMGAVYAANDISMGWCLDCHRNPAAHVRPPADVTVMGYVPPEPQEVLGKRLVQENSIHPPVHCSGCHR
jgi:hypothetical protein